MKCMVLLFSLRHVLAFFSPAFLDNTPSYKNEKKHFHVCQWEVYIIIDYIEVIIKFLKVGKAYRVSYLH